MKISAPTWNEESECSISDIQDSFEYILKKHGENTANSLIRIYVNKIDSIITFKVKTGYYLQLLNPETMKLLWRTKSKITKTENDENAPHIQKVLK